MTPTPEIDNAIAAATGIANRQSQIADRVWIYGQMVWAELPAFRFVACRGRVTREIELMAGQVKRFRDGESEFFLIEMPQHMAVALRIEDLVLDAAEVERMKRNIDTSRAW